MKRVAIKERPVGTVFQWHNKTLKVVKDTAKPSSEVIGNTRYFLNNGCKVCYFGFIHNLDKIAFTACKLKENRNCSTYYRTDKTDIHYEEVSD